MKIKTTKKNEQRENEDNKTSWSQHFDQHVVMPPLEGSTNLVLSILAEGSIIFTTYIKSTTYKQTRCLEASPFLTQRAEKL